MPAPFLKKPGKHGTLYRFAIPYWTGDNHSDAWLCWAYDAEHAIEKFEDSDDGEGWEVAGEPRKVRE